MMALVAELEVIVSTCLPLLTKWSFEPTGCT